MAISMRPKVYRGKSGWHVGGRPKDKSGGIFPYSIFVHCRSTAVRVKKLLNAGLSFEERTRRLSRLMEADARVKVCRR